MDRRIKRTRTAVFNAVLDLMVEKDTSKITVLELCKRADINKAHFICITKVWTIACKTVFKSL